ncbi:DUF421 domain-containing protein [Devosia sp.]|uniref:DUF421 domain-containing protein n=1 Tax=Devosia sp. TaxID=1871048 RepID=UPI003A91CE11
MDFSAMFFQGWEDIVRTVIVGVAAYVGLVLFLRISGKRTLAKLNAFDLVVTVALGSTLSAILLQESVALAEGLVGFAVLIALQYLVTFTSVRFPPFARVVRSEPSLVLQHGTLLEKAAKRERITGEEVESAVRASGGASLADADQVVLESDGSLSVRLL